MECGSIAITVLMAGPSVLAVRNIGTISATDTASVGIVAIDGIFDSAPTVLTPTSVATATRPLLMPRTALQYSGLCW